MKLGETLGERRHRSKGAEACQPLALGRVSCPADERVAWGHVQATVRATAHFPHYSLLAVLFFFFDLSLSYLFFSVDFPSGSACWKCSHVIQFFSDVFRFGHCDKIFEVIRSKRGKICSGRLFQTDMSNLWAHSHMCPRTAVNVLCQKVRQPQF